MSGKNNNRSLFLYTALIFIVAILMIVISFFSQINLQKHHDEYMNDENNPNTIAQKVAQLSEDNRILLDTTNSLNEKNNDLSLKNNELNVAVNKQKDKLANLDIIIKVVNDINNNEYHEAAISFLTINNTDLTPEQQELYDYMNKKLAKEIKKVEKEKAEEEAKAAANANEQANQ